MDSRLPKKSWLNWNATQFTTTEINGSFYRTPSLELSERLSAFGKKRVFQSA
jgi:uncharacterized protein YecE (DUF72 family)